MLIIQTPLRTVECIAIDRDSRIYASGGTYKAHRRHPENRGLYIWNRSADLEHLFANRLVSRFFLNPTHPWLYISFEIPLELESDFELQAVHLVTGGSKPLAPAGQWSPHLLCGEGSQLFARHEDTIVSWTQTSTDLEPAGETAAGRVCWIIAIDPQDRYTYELNIFNEDGEFTRERRFIARDLKDWSARSEMLVPRSDISELAVSPDGSTVVLNSSRGFLIRRVKEAEPGFLTVKSDAKRTTGIAFHPSGRFLAATSNDTTVKLYDTTTWQLARTYSWNVGRLRSIAFSPDGMLAAAGSDTGRIVVWDVEE